MENANKSVSGNGDHADCAGHPDCLRDWRGDWHGERHHYCLLNVTPFITTLGTMIIVYGINSFYYDFVGASPISGFDGGFSTFAQGFGGVGGFPALSYITFTP